jgi:diguanylate cyclase (GGDEF)-like protein
LEEEAFIGRGEENTIVLDMDTVSRSHASITRKMYGKYEIEDLMSTNGTYVNDQLIEEKATLKHKDRIKVGQTVFRFISGPNLETLYYQEVYDCFVRDGLTGAYKQHYLVDNLIRAVARSRRHNRTLCLAVLGVDDFIGITDDMGRMAADKVLKQVADELEKFLNPDEMAARAHNEQFDILLEEYTIEEAEKRLNDLRAHLEELDFGFEDDAFQITVSIAVQALPANVTRGPEWILKLQEVCHSLSNSGGATVKVI